MTKTEILAKLAEFDTIGETRSLTDDEFDSVKDLEVELKRANDTEEFRARAAAYIAPTASVAAAVNVAVAKQDTTLERAFDAYMRTGQENADLTELRAQGVASGSTGGYLVPTTLLNKITERQKAFGGVASRANVMPSDDGAPWKWPTLDDTGNAGVIQAENSAPTSGGADAVFGQKSIGAFTYSAPGANNLPLLVSRENLQDSQFDIEGLIVRMLATRISRKQSQDWVNGVGTTQPFGLVNGTAASTVFNTAAPTYAELINAYHSIDPDYLNDAVWSFNHYTLGLIESIVDGNGRPLLNSLLDGVSTGPSNRTLLGFPVVIDQAWANYDNTTTNAWGSFGDLGLGYIIRQVAGVELIVNPYTYAHQGQVAYTLRQRADGNIDDVFAFRVLKNTVAS